MNRLAAVARALFAAMAHEMNVPAERAMVEVARRERNMAVKVSVCGRDRVRREMLLLWDFFGLNTYQD